MTLPAVPVRGTTTVVGVFGYPVKHSASPPMHNAAFAALGLDWAYVPFTVAPEQVGTALAGVRALGLRGVNVTVPLKELVPPHLDELTTRARALGVVNTVVNEGGRLRGDATDGPGLLAALAHGGATVGPGTRVVVLGAGGSARAVVYALAEAGASVIVANRSVERAEALTRDFAGVGDITPVALTPDAVSAALTDAAVLVNTTSVGMHPNAGEMPPVTPDALRPDLFVSDLIYNPRETRLLALAREQGCRTQNGVEMLVRQGALAFTQWTGVEPPLDAMREAVLAALAAPK
jgi:shikimate dehydrogenase